jgi:hypothetical protein
MFVIIITATYSGNLTASLAVKSFKMPFNTLDELAANDDYIFQVRIGAFREQIFRVSPSCNTIYLSGIITLSLCIARPQCISNKYGDYANFLNCILLSQTLWIYIFIRTGGR